MNNCDANQTDGIAAASRPRWRAPRLTSADVGTSTRDDNPPGAPFDGLISYSTSFHENS